MARRGEVLNPRGKSMEEASIRESCARTWAWEAGGQLLKGQQRGDRRTRFGKEREKGWKTECEAWGNTPEKKRHRGDLAGTERRGPYGVLLWKEVLTLSKTRFYGKSMGRDWKKSYYACQSYLEWCETANRLGSGRRNSGDPGPDRYLLKTVTIRLEK